MKKWFTITGLFLLTIFIACKKDTGPLPHVPEPLPQPQVYVEYRNPFIGTYVGSQFSSSSGNFNGVKQPVDSVTKFNVTETITKSLTNDSSIVSKLFKREFHVNAKGEWKYYHPEYPIMEIYNLRFSNDSVYIYHWYNLHGGTTNIGIVLTFNGKRQ